MLCIHSPGKQCLFSQLSVSVLSDRWTVHPVSITFSCTLMIYCSFSPSVAVCWKKLLCLYRVVKEEISDDNARLPCFNGRVVSWVSSDYVCTFLLLFCDYCITVVSISWTQTMILISRELPHSVIILFCFDPWSSTFKGPFFPLYCLSVVWNRLW